MDILDKNLSIKNNKLKNKSKILNNQFKKDDSINQANLPSLLNNNDKDHVGLTPALRSKSVANLLNLKNDLKNKQISNETKKVQDNKKLWKKDIKDFKKFELEENLLNDTKISKSPSKINNQIINETSRSKFISDNNIKPVGYHFNKSKTENNLLDPKEKNLNQSQ